MNSEHSLVDSYKSFTHTHAHAHTQVCLSVFNTITTQIHSHYNYEYDLRQLSHTCSPLCGQRSVGVMHKHTTQDKTCYMTSHTYEIQLIEFLSLPTSNISA